MDAKTLKNVIFISFQENSDVIGVKYLHAYITSRGYNSSILLIPNTKRENVNSAIDYIAETKPGVLCLSIMTYEFLKAKYFVSALKDKLSSETPLLICGGIHATADPESCLEISDIVVRGEGEEVLLELLQAFEANASGGDLSKIQNIAYRDTDRVIMTDVRQPIENLDELPYPQHLPERMYVIHRGAVRSIRDPRIYRIYARYKGTFLSAISTRGCPFSCAYCCNSIFKGLYPKNIIRERSVDALIDELCFEIRKFDNILYINFQDDCFMVHSSDWFDRFSRQYSQKIAIPFAVRTTPKHITREKLELLKTAGLRWVFVGLQTGSDRINRQIYNRNVTSEEFLEAARIISDLRLSCWYDVILDNPYETEEDCLKTINVLLRTPRPFQLDIFSLDFFPGTDLRLKALSDGIQLPEIGTKFLTQFQPTMNNRYIRMSAILPPSLIKLLLKIRKKYIGKMAGLFFYYFSLALEPFSYVKMVHNSNDFNLFRTVKVVMAFSSNAVNKLLLRRLG